LVMEGPTDVMAAADAGIAECVAVLGTAFTPEHAKQLGNLPGEGGKLILILDGDRAGQTNALKAVRTCLSSGVPCWVATLPDELDPSELLKEDAAGGGRARFEQVVQQARADVEHLLRAIAPRPHELDHRALLAAADEVLEVLRGITDPELRGLYLRDLGSWLGIDRARLDKRLAGAGGPATQAQAHHGAADLPAVDDAIVHILVCRPELRDEAFDRLGLEPSHLVETVRPLVERLVLEPGIDGDGLLLACEAAELAPLKPLLFHWLTTQLTDRVPAIASDNAQTVLVASIERLRRTRAEEELRRVTNAITEAEHRRDFAEAGRLGREKLALTRALADLRGG
jgi:DNA primase